MAAEATIGGEGTLFIGEDKTIVATVVDVDGVPVNIASWTVLLDVRLKDNSPDPAVFSITGSITGTYSVDPALNTQKVSFALTDDQLNTVTKRTYRYSIKRMTPGFEAVLAYGDWVMEKATAP